MTDYEAVPASDESFEHGEGPVWDPVRSRLLWVDTMAGGLLEGALTHDGEHLEVTRRRHFAEMINVVVPDADGGLLVGGQESLFTLDADGTRTDGPRIVPAGTGRRLNDGATDPAGRFLVGTMRLTVESTSEELVRLEPDGRLTRLDDAVTLSNGLAWTADGRRMYHSDTLAHVVWVRDYDPSTGAVGPREVHLDFSPEMPDGVAIDTEDHLWVALFGAGEIRRHAPDGSLVDRVRVAAPRVTSLTFGGDDLRRLLITSSYYGLDEAQREAHPDSGRIFTVRVAATGTPVVPWSGAGG